MLSKIFKIWLLLVILVTGICFFVYVVVQQNYRQSANDPQIQVAEDVAAALSRGVLAQSIVPQDRVDMSQSLAPFIMVYDTNGNLLVSSGYVGDKTPTLPAGVFSYVKNYGEDRITWQPASGVRIAAVVTKYSSGFVLVGRSLREVEKREDKLLIFTEIAWLISVVFIGLFVLLGGL